MTVARWERCRDTGCRVRPYGEHLGYLPALDGVRAAAVAAVLAFHGGLAPWRGGFLGVDAFFVLSGFLITSLLLAERARTGRIALVAFWGRRVRRLLPALLLLLAVVVVVARRLTPATELAALRVDTLAALGYVANWRMTWRGGDYFADTGAPSPLLHTWSLGIEEQFYLLWPLVVVLVLTRFRPVVLLWAAIVGAVGSTATAAALYDPADLDRVYYGTDTRAAALLVGCALAALLTLRATAVRTRRPGRHGPVWFRALAVGALLAVVGLWTRADGADPWLYRGGLLAAAVAVAVVIAYAVEQPESVPARLLALPPLVWLGRISYGVYLWHWPLFGWLNGERTGLSGPTLFAVRCGATLGAAILSYLLVERPIRYRTRSTRHRTGSPSRRRFAPAALTGAALATVAALTMIATSPQPLPETRQPAAVAAVPNAPQQANRSPLRRAGRSPGALPRVAFFGDSVAWSLGTYLPRQPNLAVTVRAVQGCGIARLPDVRYLGTPHGNYPGCDRWDERWRRGVQGDDPDLAVILLDRWELMDRRLGNGYQHVGQPEYDAYLTRELELAIDTVSAGVRMWSC